MPKIKSINSHKILNSRGDWTIETEVILDNGASGVQAVPEGASKGINEAVCLPAAKAAYVTSTVINDALIGEDAFEQEALDQVMIQMDGTENKSHLGGNSILSVSLAISRAVAITKKMELYQYLNLLYSQKKTLPTKFKVPSPVFNIINGGKHAQNNLSFQEFMVIPAQHLPYSTALDMGVEIYHNLKTILMDNGYEVEVGDEGGFAPTKLTAKKAYDLITKAVPDAYKIGEMIFLGMDAAAESFYSSTGYEIKEEHLKLTREGLMDYYKKLTKHYPIIYLEDPFYEKDYGGWKLAFNELASKLMIVGDDLVVTNPKYLKLALENNYANAFIVKPNQVGTLTETLDFIRKAKSSGSAIIISHRSGETGEDTFISDLAVGVGAEFIKAGAPVRGERVVKYNRLLEIFNDNK